MVFQTKVYGESTRITPHVLHWTLSLSNQCYVCSGFLWWYRIMDLNMVILSSAVPSACFSAELLLNQSFLILYFEAGYLSYVQCLPSPLFSCILSVSMPLMNFAIECSNKMHKQPLEQEWGFASRASPNQSYLDILLLVHTFTFLTAQLHNFTGRMQNNLIPALSIACPLGKRAVFKSSQAVKGLPHRSYTSLERHKCCSTVGKHLHPLIYLLSWSKLLDDLQSNMTKKLKTQRYLIN